MSAFRIVVLASGSGTNLQAILDRLHGKSIPKASNSGPPADVQVEIVGVGSDRPEARALKRAATADVETATFPGSDFAGDREARDEALGDWIEGLGAELVVLAGYMQLLSSDFVRRFHGRLINIHPSLLPAFKGLDAIGQALDYGATVTGVTVHFVDEGVDSGPIIAQRAVPVPAGRSRTKLEQAIHAVEHELLPETIYLIAAGRVRLGEGRAVSVK